jgi:hypothetical protein
LGFPSTIERGLKAAWSSGVAVLLGLIGADCGEPFVEFVLALGSDAAGEAEVGDLYAEA